MPNNPPRFHDADHDMIFDPVVRHSDECPKILYQGREHRVTAHKNHDSFVADHLILADTVALVYECLEENIDELGERTTYWKRSGLPYEESVLFDVIEVAAAVGYAKE